MFKKLKKEGVIPSFPSIQCVIDLQKGSESET